MRTETMLLGIALLVILAATGNMFWLLVAGLLFVLHLFSLSLRATGKGAKRVYKKAKDVYAAEYKEIDAAKGSYPKGFFDSVGKAVGEKIGDMVAPKGVKKVKDVDNYYWAAPKDPVGNATSTVQKFLDGLGKLFGK